MSVTPVAIGNQAESEGSGSQTTTITTSVTAPIGMRRVVLIGHANARTIGTVSDSAGETYTQLKTNGTSPICKVYIAAGTAALASGGTITIASTGIGAGVVAASAFYCGPYKVTADSTGGTTGGSGDPTCSHTSVANNVLVYALAAQINGAAPTLDSEDPDWNTLAGAGSSGIWMSAAYRIFPTPATNEWNPDLSISVAWASASAGLELLSGLPQLCIVDAGAP